MDQVVNYLLGASLVLNVGLAYFLRQKRQRPLTTDAKQLLHELTTGGAVVKVEVLDTSALFYRSPRG